MTEQERESSRGNGLSSIQMTSTSPSFIDKTGGSEAEKRATHLPEGDTAAPSPSSSSTLGLMSAAPRPDQTLHPHHRQPKRCLLSPNQRPLYIQSSFNDRAHTHQPPPPPPGELRVEGGTSSSCANVKNPPKDICLCKRSTVVAAKVPRLPPTQKTRALKDRWSQISL